MELAAAAAKSTSAWDQPGTLGFLVVFGMGIVLYFVFRSLAKQLRKVNLAAQAEARQAESGAAAQANGLPTDTMFTDTGSAEPGLADSRQAPSVPGPLGRGSLGQRPPG
jgi:hypothetical protein